MFYPLHKKGGSFYEDPIIHKSGLERCMLFTSITRMYKLYLFPIKISGAITDFSVYVYHLLNRENGMVRYRLQMGCDCTAVVSFFFFLFFFLRMSVSVRSSLNVSRTSSVLDRRNLLFCTINTVLQYL